MKTLILLVGISLTLANPSPSGGKASCTKKRKNEFVITETKFPEKSHYHSGNPRPKDDFALPLMKFPEMDNLKFGMPVLSHVLPEKKLPESEQTDRPRQENEFVIPEKQYPEVITEFINVDYSDVPIEQLIQLAAEHEGLEFLSDTNATAAMGFDVSTLSHDIIADALATTV